MAKINGISLADIHFGKKDDKLLYKELEAVFFKKITEMGNTLDIVVIAGDLFDRVIKMNEEGSIYINNFINKLIRYSKEYVFIIRILKGTKSHDFNQLDNFKHLSNDTFKIIDTVEEEEIFEGVYVLYLPEEYVTDPDTYYAPFFNLEEGVKYDLLFFHGNMDFAAYASKITSERNVKNSVTFKSEQISSLVYGPALGGHVHTKDNYKNKVFYSGSFSRYAFGEEEDKGFYTFIYDPEDLSYVVNFVKNPLAPTYATIKFSDLEGELDEKMKTLEILKDEYDNIRIEFSYEDKNQFNSSLEALRTINDDKIKIKVERNIENEIDTKYLFILRKEFDTETTIQKFIQLNNNVTINLDIIKEAIKKDDIIDE